MKTAALSVIATFALAGCGGEDCSRSATAALYSDTLAPLFRIAGDQVECLGATSVQQYEPEDSIVCQWQCIRFEGRATRYLYLEFRRTDEGRRLAGVSVEYSRIAECENIADIPAL